MQNNTTKQVSKAQLLDEWASYRDSGNSIQRENLTGRLYAGAILEWAGGDVKKALRELYLFSWGHHPQHPEIETVATFLSDLLVERPDAIEELEALVLKLELKARKMKAESEISNLSGANPRGGIRE